MTRLGRRYALVRRVRQPHFRGVIYNDLMATSPDVLVIGGGIIGLTSAYYLAKAGLSVELIERGELGREASWAGAGIIPPGWHPERATTAIDRLRAYSVRQFEDLSQELRKATGIDNGYRRRGGIEFITRDDEDAVEMWRVEGIRFERVSGEYAPYAVPPAGSVPYLLRDCAQVRNPWHLKALIEACRLSRVRLHTEEIVYELQASADGKSVRSLHLHNPHSGTTRYPQAGAYLVTAGAWSGRLFLPHGVELRVHPVRGQIVLFNAGRPLFPHVLMAGKRYLVPRDDGRILVGSTEEPEAGFEKATTPEAIGELVQFAEQLVPALGGAPVEKTWAGLRPGSPDGMPFIGPVPGLGNVFAAVGHFRAGIQLSIGTAELVRDLITGRPTAIPAEPYRLDRVPDMTARPAFRS